MLRIIEGATKSEFTDLRVKQRNREIFARLSKKEIMVNAIKEFPAVRLVVLKTLGPPVRSDY